MIVAFMSALAGVNLHGKGRDNLDSIARNLMTDLRYVRSKAMVNNRDTEVRFDLAQNTYVSRAADIDRSLPESLSLALTVDATDIDGNTGRIVFYPDGSSSGGKVVLTMNARTMEVTTTWLNGYVSLR